MARRLLLASAGAGKSEQIVKRALEQAAGGVKVLLLTYTINNQIELVRHICHLNKIQPRNVVIKGWFSFLLEDMVRPYQRAIVPERISGIVLNSGNPHLARTSNRKTFNIKYRAEKINGQYNSLHYVTKEGNRAHTYYLAKLAAMIHKDTSGKPARRLAEIYQAVFIDEMQDLVGWDFAIIRAMIDANISEFECVGDFRQTVYQTSETTKAPQAVAEKLAALKDMGFTIEFLAISWRCIQSICDLADQLHARDGFYEPTMSQVSTVPEQYADHQGVFAVSESRIEEYIKQYSPVILRWNRQARVPLSEGCAIYNFGEAKGLGFDRILIIPPERHAKFLGGDITAFNDASTDDSRNKLYVGVTRARYSVAFRHEGQGVVSGVQVWK